MPVAPTAARGAGPAAWCVVGVTALPDRVRSFWRVLGCPYLGCHVHCNDAEKTWDCPCHGSRFDTKGTVLNGPAARGLERVELPRGG